MKARTLVSASILAFAAVGSAHAQLTPFQGVYGKQYSNVTRAQVIQEMHAAKAAGLTGNEDMDNQPFVAQKETGTDHAATATAGAATQADATPKGVGAMKFGDIDNMPFQGH
ncbi:DUF4148 domain-containing protein [Bordetella flabilis]|uniref:DUF4148 domain-containing protein n=1 Tax=Bordetella flabilis TaxID=463014 RepID=A0A193GGM5_9BORD|nr:DUF4148 domain-containing protein [Bordetella flabilis]ANN78449.1 hypothetical protein BAU07_16225 [Bordetella flabilis]